MEDCRAVYELICDMEAKTLPYDAFDAIYRKQLSDDRYECILCEQDTNVIAMINLRYEDQLHHAGCIAEIMEFVVKAGYRDKGYGKDLFRHACRCSQTCFLQGTAAAPLPCMANEALSRTRSISRDRH